ncbi:MAG: pseudouridine synthase [Dokdonella sp.]
MPRPPTRPPAINGVNASTVLLLAGPWPTLLDALCARFPYLSRDRWLSRFARKRVIDPQGQALSADAAHVGETIVHYYREVDDEQVIPFEEIIVHADADLIIADKPHFLPVTPAGRHVEETLLARLIRRYHEPDLVPLHRIDAGTAGLVMFSRNPATRATYQALFRKQRINKRYEALAPPLPDLDFPLLRQSRIVAGEPFYRMREVDGEPNAQTRIEVIDRGETLWRYALFPVSGRQHQLRVQMASLGAPLLNDDVYPAIDRRNHDDFRRPLQLLARALEFGDPISGEQRCFESTRALLTISDD